ncbi:MAG: hypothetical protein AABY15_06540 [Nanoarchaeota archaeon]
MEKTISTTGVNGTFSGTIVVNMTALTVSTYVGPDLLKEYTMEDAAEIYRKSNVIEDNLEYHLKNLADGPPAPLSVVDKLRLKGYE